MAKGLASLVELVVVVPELTALQGGFVADMQYQRRVRCRLAVSAAVCTVLRTDFAVSLALIS
jgi:hypothetical protein